MRAPNTWLAASLLAGCHIVSGLSDFEEGESGGGSNAGGGAQGGAATTGGGAAGGDGGGGGAGGVGGEPGELVWLVGFQGNDTDRGRAIAHIDDKVGVVADYRAELSGASVSTATNGAADIAVLALDPETGGPLTPAANTFGSSDNEIAQAVVVGLDGSIYSCGSYREGFTFAGQSATPSSGEAGFVTRHNADGSEGWLVTFRGNNDGACHGIASDGSVLYATGYFNGNLNWPGDNIPGSGDNAFLAKIALDGTPLDAVSLDGAGDVYTHSVSMVGADPVVAGGFVNDFTVDGHTVSWAGPLSDLFVLQFDADLEVAWDVVVGGDGVQEAEWVASSPSRIVVAARYRETFTVGVEPNAGDGSLDAAFLSLEPGGAVEWATVFRGPGDDSARAVAVSGNDVFVGLEFNDSLELGAGGRVLDTMGNADGLLARLSPAGELIWHQQIATGSRDVVWGISADSTGVYATGATGNALTVGDTTLDYVGDREIWVARFNP